MFLNLRDPAFAHDPYPTYAALHAQSPMLRQSVGHVDAYFLARHADVLATLKNPNVGHAEGLSPAYAPASLRPLIALQENLILFLNPPRHGHLRGLVVKAFSPQAMDRLKTRVTQCAHRLLDVVMSRGATFDLVNDFAGTLPLETICELIGIPEQGRPLLQRLTKQLAQSIDVSADPAFMAQGAQAAVEFERYFLPLIAERRVHPEEDLVSDLLAAEAAGGTLSNAEIVSTCALLLVAGSETTVSLISNGVYALLKAHEKWHSLVNDPASIPLAIEEMLRYDSPLQIVSRVVLNDTEIGGQNLQRGTPLYLLIGAANRDPLVFDDPDGFHIQRQPNPHLAFSSGIHFCLGSFMARMEAHIALQVLCQRMPSLTLASSMPLAYHDTTTLRGLKTLPVKWQGT